MAMNHDMAEQLARRIRAVLGEFNDDDKGVETLVRELAEQRRAHLTQPALAVDVGRRVGWMIESTEGWGWWTGKQVWDFTRDPNAAVVFPDESSAEWFAIARFHGSGKATEHVWMHPLTAALPNANGKEG